MKELTYSRFILPTVERLAHKTAVLDGLYTATYDQHLDRVLRIGDALRAIGVQPGDRFAVMALNGHQYLELYHASLLTGAVITPLNLRLAPTELELILADSGTKVCFADGFFAGGIDRVRAGAGLDQLVLIGPGDVAHDVDYEALLESGRATVPPEPEEESAAVLMYTGGTTGLPKGVVLDQRALMIDMYKILSRWVLNEDYVYLHQTPMFHAASLGGVLGVSTAGGTSTSVPLFTPESVLDTIERDRVTQTVMVPTMIAMMLDHPAFAPERLASLETLVYGASPMPGALLERLLVALPHVNLYQGYGMTECCGLLTSLGPEEHRRGGPALRSAGRPLPGSVVTIQDEEGRVLGPGVTGEVCAKAGNFMREYWNRPDETADAFRDGWYRTGDAGYMDDDGYVYLVDRVKDMIVTGGENVYSAEVENAIASHPAVAQVAVIGIPSEQWGEAVHAIVVPRNGAEVNEADIRAWARERIAGYKVPKSVELRADPLPLSGAMKVLKRELRRPFWDDTERSVG